MRIQTLLLVNCGTLAGRKTDDNFWVFQECLYIISSYYFRVVPKFSVGYCYFVFREIANEIRKVPKAQVFCENINVENFPKITVCLT
jgi:hypothetical protein